MYSFVTHTWNTVKGKCPHACSYCYMRQDRLNPIRFDAKELKTPFGAGKFIFVGSSCDMWAQSVPETWIRDTLENCQGCSFSRFLFQSKNPRRFRDFYGQYPWDTIFGTTIESNREYPEIFRNAPPVIERYESMIQLSREGGCEFMITIEPILDFDLKPFVEMIRDIEPTWVNIGADSKGHKLPEPSAEKIRALIDALKEITGVKVKKNLRRILSAG